MSKIIVGPSEVKGERKRGAHWKGIQEPLVVIQYAGEYVLCPLSISLLTLYRLLGV